MNNVLDVKIHAVCLYYPKNDILYWSFPIFSNLCQCCWPSPPEVTVPPIPKKSHTKPPVTIFCPSPWRLDYECAWWSLRNEATRVLIQRIQEGNSSSIFGGNGPIEVGGWLGGKGRGVWKRMWRSDLWKWKQNWILLNSANAQILSDISILQNQDHAETCGFPPLSLLSEKCHNILSDAVCLEQGCIDCLRAVLDAGTALQIRGGEVGHPFLKLQEVRGLAAWRIVALPKSTQANWKIGKRWKKSTSAKSYKDELKYKSSGWNTCPQKSKKKNTGLNKNVFFDTWNLLKVIDKHFFEGIL